jgi:hypothetical protein
MLADYCFVPQTMVAVAFTGVFVGAASQGLAYAIVWDDDTVRNMAMLQCGLFCLLWTAWTVGVNVLFGWNLTRCGRASRDTGNTTNPQQQRKMLRMESVYFAGSILGIWSAWVGIHALHNDMRHAISRLSIMSCATILHFLPEESCVEEPASEVEQGSYVPPQLLLAAETV